MKIRVLGFASAGEALGAPEVELEVPADSSLGDLEGPLLAAYPSLAKIFPRLALAVDGELAAADRPLRPGCEVALLPPVSGG
ncbi:MAG: MoaD/ThiS family protein [Acidobacteriota bacterium]